MLELLSRTQTSSLEKGGVLLNALPVSTTRHSIGRPYRASRFAKRTRVQYAISLCPAMETYGASHRRYCSRVKSGFQIRSFGPHSILASCLFLYPHFGGGK